MTHRKRYRGKNKTKNREHHRGGKVNVVEVFRINQWGKEKKRKGKIKLVSGNKDRIVVEKARG